MNKKLVFVLVISLVALALDHITKWWIVENVNFGEYISVIPNIFDIVHTRNKGAAFGFLHDWNSPYRNTFFYGIALIAFACIVYYIRTTLYEDKVNLLALSLILGGAFGNIADRIFRGSVVDFLSFRYHDVVWSFSLFGSDFNIPLIWPAFNVADSCIFVGVFLLIWRSFCPFKPHEKTS